MVSVNHREMEPYLRERARQHAERRSFIIIERNSFQNAVIELCSRLSELMQRRQDPWVQLSKIERIYNEEEMLLLRQKLCLI